MSLKSILVTGCSAGGIGAAVALALARKGHHVFATARNTSKIPQELSNLSNVTVLPLDVTSMLSVTAAAKTVSESGHGLDVLVNNAGASYIASVLDMDIEQAQRLHDTNLWGCVRTTQAFTDLLIAGRGRIVNISSMGGMLNLPFHSAYVSSKAALNSISETLRLELSPFGVSVLTVMVGSVKSNFDANSLNLCLPSESRYASIKNFVYDWASGKSKPDSCSAEEFAQTLSDDIIGRGKSGIIWRASYARVTGFAVSWLPTWVMDMAWSQNLGLRELSRRLSKEETGN